MKQIVILLCILAILVLIQIKLLNRESFTTYNNVEYSNNLTIKDIKDLKKGQKIMTKMFKEFDSICRKHKIKYWCIGGTLIGALRHKGWIPWDGDIDIGMIKKDYDKFITVNKELPNDIKNFIIHIILFYYIILDETNFYPVMYFSNINISINTIIK